MHIPNPEKLNDSDWAENLQNLHFIRTEEKKSSQMTNY